MTTMVCFDSAGAAYCMPVGATRAVLRSGGLIALPAPHLDVAGIIPGDPPLTVISPLGSGGEQILVTEHGRPVARLSPVGAEVDRMTALVDAGIVRPPHARARRLPSKRVKLTGGRSLDDEVAAQRR